MTITTAADGKVVATRSKAKPGARRKDKKTGRPVKKRFDPDKARYHEGGGAEARGLKFLPVHTRTPFGRIVLDIPYVAGVSPKDEADATVEVLRELRPLLPGPHFHVHDGAMTAEHNQALLTELGTVLVNRTKAKSNPKVKGRSIGKRVAHEGLVERKVLACPDGTEEVLLIYERDGDLGLLELTETGAHHFVPLKATKLIVNENKNPESRTLRPYVALTLPADIAVRTGRREVTVAIYQTRADKKRGYLRSAWVRAVGPGSKDFWIYTQMRSDSESLNRTVEDSLYRHHRAHSDGWARQQVDMLGLAGLINALTRERMRRKVLYQAA